MSGALTVVGLGITLVSHLTAEANAHIRAAELVLYLFPHQLADEWMRSLNPAARSLAGHYQPGRDRAATYAAMVDDVLHCLGRGLRVCVAFYGHPGVFVSPGHAMVRAARQAGYATVMLPGISAEDCLIADLGLDPGAYGCQSYEASDLLARHYPCDPRSLVLLWQVGVIHHYTVADATLDPRPGLLALVRHLSQFYRPDHPAVMYEAAVLPTSAPICTPCVLGALPDTPTTPRSTLVIPPARFYDTQT